MFRLEEQERRQAELRGFDSDDDDEIMASALAAVETLCSKKKREEEEKAAAAAARENGTGTVITAPVITDLEPINEKQSEMETEEESGGHSCSFILQEKHLKRMLERQNGVI